MKVPPPDTGVAAQFLAARERSPVAAKAFSNSRSRCAAGSGLQRLAPGRRPLAP